MNEHLKVILVVMASLTVCVIIVITINQIQTDLCVKSHIELRHSSAFYTTTYIGGVPIMNYYPGYDYNATVCDEYQKVKH